jgi:hypothetical protein
MLLITPSHSNQVAGILGRYRETGTWRNDNKLNSPLFEVARVFVRVDHAASFIVNANYGVV